MTKNLILFFILLTGILFGPRNAYSFDYHNLNVKINSRVREMYDDNITYVKENRKKDFITNLSVELGIEYEGKTSGFSIDAGVTQQIFAGHPNYNNTAETASLNFKQELSKYDRISVSDDLSHTYEARSFEEAFVRTGGRYSYFNNNFRINYEKDLLKQLGVSAWYANSINIISRKGSNDSYLNAAGAEARYFLSSTAIPRLSYDFTRRAFTNGGNASKHTVAAGARYYITRKLYFDGKAGIDIMNSYDDKDYARPVIVASLMNDIDRTSRAGITFMKKYEMNPYVEDLFDQWQILCVFGRQPFKRLGYAISGFFGRGEYVAYDIKDKFWGVNSGLTYDFTKNIKGRVDYSYSNRASDEGVMKYSKNRVLVGLAVEF